MSRPRTPARGPGRPEVRTVVAVVFILSAFGLSVLCSWHDVGPERLSPRAAPGGGALLVGVTAALVPTGVAWLLMRRRSQRPARGHDAASAPRRTDFER